MWSEQCFQEDCCLQKARRWKQRDQQGCFWPGPEELGWIESGGQQRRRRGGVAEFGHCLSGKWREMDGEEEVSGASFRYRLLTTRVSFAKKGRIRGLWTLFNYIVFAERKSHSAWLFCEMLREHKSTKYHLHLQSVCTLTLRLTVDTSSQTFSNHQQLCWGAPGSLTAGASCPSAVCLHVTCSALIVSFTTPLK